MSYSSFEGGIGSLTLQMQLVKAALSLPLLKINVLIGLEIQTGNLPNSSLVLSQTDA